MNDNNDLIQDQKADMALILEGQLQERVKKIVEPIIERMVINLVGKEIYKAFEKEKQNMMMEISVTLGKVIGAAQRNEDRRPLWESTPKEFGLLQEDLNSHMMGDLPTPEERKVEGEVK